MHWWSCKRRVLLVLYAMRTLILRTAYQLFGSPAVKLMHSTTECVCSSKLWVLVNFLDALFVMRKNNFGTPRWCWVFFIPEEPASWELYPEYQELQHPHKRCDLENCVCKNGCFREVIGTEWEIGLCHCCGHMDISNPDWECDRWCTSMPQQMQMSAF